MNDQTYIGNYRTPHTDKLRLVERFRLIESGNALEVNVYAEGAEAFTIRWNAIQRYRCVEPGPMIEVACAENNINPFHQGIEPMPGAARPHF
jgi:hypothetical protein